jgi:hypothetical protein
MRTAVLRATLVAYAALLTAPVATVLPGSTWSLFAGGLVVGAALGTALTARLDAAGWLSTVPRGVGGLVVPLLWLFPVVEAGSIATPWFLGAAAVVPWLLAVLTASYCRTQGRIEAARTGIAFEARQPPAQRRQLTLAAGVLLAFSVVAGAVILVVSGDFDWDSMLTWLPGSMVAVMLLLSDRDEREVAVTDAGLVVQQQLYGWDTIADYELTDEALVLSRTDWYRSELQYDRQDIEDLDAVTAALDKFLS